MNPKIAIFWSLFILIFSCRSIKKPLLTDYSSGIETLDRIKYSVVSLKVTPLEKAVNGSLFRSGPGVSYNRELDIYRFGGDIEYDVKFEIITDSIDEDNSKYQLDDVRIFKKTHFKSDSLFYAFSSDYLFSDSIFIIPTFRKVNSKENQTLRQNGKVHLAHHSSSSWTNVIFQLKDKEVIIKTHFAKPMVPGG